MLTSLLGGFVTACSLVTDLDGLTCGAACDAPDATAEGASSGEASTLDTSSPANDAGAATDSADAAKDAANEDSSVVPALTYLCPGVGQVADCASCAGGGYPCVLCGSAGSDVTKLRGICVTSPSSGSACEGKGPAGYDDCLCPGTSDPSPCPLPYQVCAAQSGPACRTCGWDGGTGLTCRGGGVCSAAGHCN